MLTTTMAAAVATLAADTFNGKLVKTKTTKTNQKSWTATKFYSVSENFTTKKSTSSTNPTANSMRTTVTPTTTLDDDDDDNNKQQQQQQQQSPEIINNVNINNKNNNSLSSKIFGHTSSIQHVEITLVKGDAIKTIKKTTTATEIKTSKIGVATSVIVKPPSSNYREINNNNCNINNYDNKNNLVAKSSVIQIINSINNFTANQ